VVCTAAARTVRRMNPTLFSAGRPAPDPVVAAVPVGQVTVTAYGKWGNATATFDRSGRYRYRLSRIWEPDRQRVCWIMLNPSTATHDVTDPTVERTLRFAQLWGYGAVEVVNLFVYRGRLL
jgi:hypothetical protein